MRLSDEKSLLEQMTIEQARQNIALLKAEEIEMPKKWVLELLNTIEALQQENEQLQAQAARMRDVLDELTSELDYAHLLENGIEWDKHKSKTFDGALELLKNIPANYHNPADMEALRKAREAIKAAWSDGSANAAMDKASEALTAIDKAIGGKEGAE